MCNIDFNKIDFDRIKTIGLFFMAIAILAYFGYLADRMFRYAEIPNDTIWARQVFIYSGIEAIVFAAAGFLFGKEVHRAQAEFSQQLARDFHLKRLNSGMIYQVHRTKNDNGWEITNKKTGIKCEISDNEWITYDLAGKRSRIKVEKQTPEDALIQAID